MEERHLVLWKFDVPGYDAEAVGQERVGEWGSTLIQAKASGKGQMLFEGLLEG